MNNNSKKYQVIIDAIKFAVRCPSCGGSFLDNDIEVITGGKDVFFAKLTCLKCSLNVVASLVNMHSKSDGNKLPNLDLVWDEDLVSKKKIISADDVIDVHYFLDKLDGGLK